MVRTLVQSIRFPGATAKQLYDLYADAKLHAQATGSPAKIPKRAGAAFSAWDGYVTGTSLAFVPHRLIVQAWRADDWSPMDPESTLVLAFHDVEGGARLDMVHAGVPESHADDLEEGWSDNYWKPWKRWLREQKNGKKKTGAKRRA